MPQDDDGFHEEGSADARRDDYGFWDDDRSRFKTGPIPRLQRSASSAKPAHAASRTHGSPAELTIEPADRPDQGAGLPRHSRRRLAVILGLATITVPVLLMTQASDPDAAQVAGEPTQQSAFAQPVATLDPVASVAAAVPGETVGVSQSVDPASTAALPTAASPSTAPTVVSDSSATTLAPVTSASTIPVRVETVSTEPSTQAPAAAVVEATAAPVTSPPTTAAPSCVIDYEIVAGDYWILIADKVSVRLSELLQANGATVDTPLYAGRDICLPANASAPTTAAPTTAAPTTAAPPTTATKSTTPKSTTPAKPTSAAPASTAPATTTATTSPPPKNTYSREQVVQIIRDVWPDDLEDEALRIATRESNLTPTVRNYCCFGLFQLYWKVHKGWMSAAGVTSSDQLYDPQVNAYMAYAMYLRAGGWGPWS